MIGIRGGDFFAIDMTSNAYLIYVEPGEGDGKWSKPLKYLDPDGMTGIMTTVNFGERTLVYRMVVWDSKSFNIMSWYKDKTTMDYDFSPNSALDQAPFIEIVRCKVLDPYFGVFAVLYDSYMVKLFNIVSGMEIDTLVLDKTGLLIMDADYDIVTKSLLIITANKIF